MPNHMKPEDRHAELMQEMKFFRKICEDIAKLSPGKYAELRSWLLMQATLNDWVLLMES